MANEKYKLRGGALFLLSTAITAHQLVLMQILSYVQWYHFAYLVVALALLGFGASGTFFALRREWLLANCDGLLPVLMLGCGLSMPFALAPSSLPLLNFDLYLLFVEPGQIMRLTAACLVYCLPFFFGGLAIALALTTAIERAGFLYFANLSGSGAGGLLGLGLAHLFLPEQLPALTGLLPVSAALLLMRKSRRAIYLVTAAGAIAFGLFLFLKPVQLLPSQFKDVSQVLNLPEARIITRNPSPHGLLQVITAKSLRQAAGLSFHYQGEIPDHAAMLVNGDTYGSLPLRAAAPQKSLLENSTEFIGYLIADPTKILLLQPGGGRPIEHALSQNATQVTAVEPHPDVNQLLTEGIGNFPGFKSHSVVKLSNNDPRAFLAESSDVYDLIRFPTAGDTGNNIGLHALSEQYLFSRRSFALGWQRLQPAGVLLASARMDYPAKNPLKLLATLVEICNEVGIVQPRQHIVALRSWGKVSFALKKTPITPDESARIRNYCNERGFDPLLLPDLGETERERFHQLQDHRFFQDVDTLFTEGREQLYQEYDFKIFPATDNRPFFSQFIRLDRLSHLVDLFTLHQIPFFEMGSFILAITLVLLVLLAICLIVLPLFSLTWQGKVHARTLMYFGGLGLGYMMLEIVFIQCLILFLGHPLTAAATVLCALLFSSGLGSLYSEKIRPRPSALRFIAGLVTLLIMVYGVLLVRSGQLISFVAPEFRILAAAIAIAPLGFILGMLFPLGLRSLHQRAPGHIPWAWGINGCLSVIGPPLATLVAVQYGFQAVFILAAAAYFLAFSAVQRNKGIPGYPTWAEKTISNSSSSCNGRCPAWACDGPASGRCAVRSGNG